MVHLTRVTEKFPGVLNSEVCLFVYLFIYFTVADSNNGLKIHCKNVFF